MAKDTKGLTKPVTFWYSADSDTIHLTVPDIFASTVTPDPVTKRGHPNLYWKLAAILRENGLPAPPPDFR